MKTIHGLENVEAASTRCVLTIGNFDGVHLAHQRLLTEARRWADVAGCKVVALTFEPHPLTIIAPHRAPKRILPLEEKLRRLEESGVDAVVAARSEPNLFGMEAERFLEEIIRRQFHPLHVVEGPTFGFGRGRKGDAALLTQFCAGFSCQVHLVPPVAAPAVGLTGELVSSSLIRRLIQQGDVGSAELCLGRPFMMIGIVVEGDGRGRTLGYPTANLDTADQIVPGEGVYAGRTEIEESTYACAISIGRRSTFGGGAPTAEVHVLDYEGDLYGRRIRVELERRLRDQRTFGSREELTEQLFKDVNEIRNDSASVSRGRREGAGRSVQAPTAGLVGR